MTSKRSSVSSPGQTSAKKARISSVDSENAIARIKASIIENDTKLDFGTSKSVIEGLLSPKTIEEFSAAYWDKKPMHVKRNQPNYYGSAFTLSALKKIVETNQLEFSEDVDVFRYIDDEKQILNESGKVTLSAIDRLLEKEKATVKFHQPQRYTDVLWNILEKLETHFGSLVSANGYVTPAQSQGLAPHCDETDTLVLQLEGSMTWQIYSPKLHLARDGTHDLSKELIGSPISSIELQTGDLLYIPRGYIHEAVNKSSASSTRVEISTYQNNAWGDFMSLAVNQAVENALDSKTDSSLRSGLPVSFGSYLGTGKNLQKYIELSKGEGENIELTKNESEPDVIDFKQQMKKKLAKLVDYIDVDTVADTFNSSFIANRLPPFEFAPKSEYTAPTKSDRIILKFKEHIKVLFYAEEDEINTTHVGYSPADDLTEDEATEDETEDEEMPEERSSADLDDENDEDYIGRDATCVKIIHSVHNDKKLHMSEPASNKPNSLKFPIHYAPAITQLVKSSDYIVVSELVGLEEEVDRISLASSLYDADLIDIKPRSGR